MFRTRLHVRGCLPDHRGAFTLVELAVVIVMVSLLVLLASVNLFGLLRRNSFKARVQEFVLAMQMAANAAAGSDRKYEVIVDITGQKFLLREITTPDLSEVLEAEIIVEGDFSDNCRVIEVVFDDGESTNEGRAKFRAGRSGWQYGGKVMFLDGDEQLYSVLVNRLNPMVTLLRGDAVLLTPRSRDDIPY